MHTYPDSREKPRQLLWRTAEYFASTCDADPAYRRYPLPECGPRQTRVRLRIALSGASRSPRHRTATGSFRQAGARPANSAFFRWGLVRVRRLALLSRDFFSATPNHGRGDGNSGPVPSRIFVCNIDTDPRVAPTRATLRRAVLGTSQGGDNDRHPPVTLDRRQLSHPEGLFQVRGSGRATARALPASP